MISRKLGRRTLKDPNTVRDDGLYKGDGEKNLGARLGAREAQILNPNNPNQFLPERFKTQQKSGSAILFGVLSLPDWGGNSELEELADEAKMRARAEKYGIELKPAPPKQPTRKDKAAAKRAEKAAKRAEKTKETEQPNKKKRERVDVEKEGLVNAELAQRRRERFGVPAAASASTVAAAPAVVVAAGLFFCLRMFFSLEDSCCGAEAEAASVPEEKEADTKRARRRGGDDEDDEDDANPEDEHVDLIG